MPIRSSEVSRNTEFETDLNKLREKYQAIDEIIEEFAELLKCGFDLPEIPVSPATPHVYVQRLDYPAHGSQGAGVLRVVYFASEPSPSPATPYQAIELLVINEVEGAPRV